MKNLSLTIKHIVWNIITKMGFYVFTYNTITTDGVLNCGGDGCEDDKECECDCGDDCGDCKS